MDTRSADLTRAEARALTEQIGQALKVAHDLITAAWRGRAWVALDYPTWDAYCHAEFPEARMVRLERGERRGVVEGMRSVGMSTRSIASALGVAHDTVNRDRVVNRLDDSVQTEPSTVIGEDGRVRPATRTTTMRSDGRPFLTADEAEAVHARATEEAEARRIERENRVEERSWTVFDLSILDLIRALETLHTFKDETIPDHLKEQTRTALTEAREFIDLFDGKAK